MAKIYYAGNEARVSLWEPNGNVHILDLHSIEWSEQSETTPGYSHYDRDPDVYMSGNAAIQGTLVLNYQSDMPRPEGHTVTIATIDGGYTSDLLDGEARVLLITLQHKLSNVDTSLMQFQMYGVHFQSVQVTSATDGQPLQLQMQFIAKSLAFTSPEGDRDLEFKLKQYAGVRAWTRAILDGIKTYLVKDVVQVDENLDVLENLSTLQDTSPTTQLIPLPEVKTKINEVIENEAATVEEIVEEVIDPTPEEPTPVDQPPLEDSESSEIRQEPVEYIIDSEQREQPRTPFNVTQTILNLLSYAPRRMKFWKERAVEALIEHAHFSNPGDEVQYVLEVSTKAGTLSSGGGAIWSTELYWVIIDEAGKVTFTKIEGSLDEWKANAANVENVTAEQLLDRYDPYSDPEILTMLHQITDQFNVYTLDDFDSKWDEQYSLAEDNENLEIIATANRDDLRTVLGLIIDYAEDYTYKLEAWIEDYAKLKYKSELAKAGAPNITLTESEQNRLTRLNAAIRETNRDLDVIRRINVDMNWAIMETIKAREIDPELPINEWYDRRIEEYYPHVFQAIQVGAYIPLYETQDPFFKRDL
jgi:hypothetical protein